MRRVAESLGGHLDGGHSRMPALTVPLATRFDAGARALHDAVHRHATASWVCGNVYEPADGMTPLSWWR